MSYPSLKREPTS